MAMSRIGGVMTYHIKDIASLYASYLPFVDNGAIFIPSERQQNLGEEVFVAINLPGSNKRMPLNGKIVWINPTNQTSRPAGFAVQFGDDQQAQNIKAAIERLLADWDDTNMVTYTM